MCHRSWVRASVGVGCTPPRSCRVRDVVGAGEVAAHQSSRNEGNVSGVAVISGVSRHFLCDRDVQQLDGCGLCQQAGRDGLLLPLLVGFGGGRRVSTSTCSKPCASGCRLPLRSSLGCLQRYLRGLTPTGFVFSGTWTTGWSSPLRRRRPKRTSTICFRLSLPRDSDKQGEFRSRPLTDSKLPWYEHRYRGRQDFSVPCAG